MAEFILPHEHGEEKGMEKIKNNLSNNESFITVADLFQQLSDPTRIRIFWLLCHYEECVINISSFREETAKKFITERQIPKSADSCIR